MKRKDYIASSVVTGLLKVAALVAAVLWLLPRWGINIPIWGLALLLVALVAYEVVTFRIGARALDKKPVVSAQAMVGCCGKTTTPLIPGGYVQVGSELWRALSTGPNIDEDEEIIVVEVKRLTLLVIPLPDAKRVGGNRVDE